MKKIGLFLIGVLLLASCGKKEAKVVNIQNVAAFTAFKKLNLDETHRNLLNSKHTTPETYKEVLASWKSFHQQIGKLMETHDFSWGSSDETIALVNKVYFEKNGKVKYYAFRVLNKTVTQEKKEVFQNLIAANIEQLTIPLQRTTVFAQCGKIKYRNK